MNGPRTKPIAAPSAAMPRQFPTAQQTAAPSKDHSAINIQSIPTR